MTTQHTPAPWVLKATESGDEQTGLIMAGDGTHQICDTGVAYWYNRRADGLSPEITNPIISRANANAKLIVAAPDLLDVLKIVEKWIVLHALDKAPLINGRYAEVPVLGLIRTAIYEATV